MCSERFKSKRIMLLIIAGLMGLNVIFLLESFKEREFISDFLNVYYSQLKIDSEGRMKIERDVNYALSQGVDGDVVSKVDFLKGFDRFLTKGLQYELMRTGYLPNFNLMSFGEQKKVSSYEIINVKYQKLNRREYKVVYDVSYMGSSGRNVIHRSEVFLFDSDRKIVNIGEIL